jgi:hypothetical protein
MGTAFFDIDNDGWLDIFVANGHMYPRTRRRFRRHRISSRHRHAENLYLSSNNLASVGLCFSVFFFLRSGTTRPAGGVPICSRAIAFTSSTALNFFGLRFFFAIGHILP